MFRGLDDRAVSRLSGAAWDAIRPNIAVIHDSLVGVSPNTVTELTTIYIKYTTSETGNRPYAVLWVKKSTEVVVGLALPATSKLTSTQTVQTSLKYAGLTTYLRYTADDQVTDELRAMALDAYLNLKI